MADDATEAPAESQDQPTPDAEAPEGTSQEATEKPDHFSEKFDPASLPEELVPAYKQMQADYTRKTQEVAALRQPDAVADYLRTLRPEDQEAVLRSIGIELQADEDDGDDDLYSDPDEELRRELEELKAWRAEQEQSRQDEEVETFLENSINDQIAALEEATGRELTEQEAQTIGEFAYDRARANGQVPDVKAAYERIYTELLPHERKRWVQSKKTPQAPNGSSASHQPDLDDPEQRREYLLQRLSASE